MGDKSVCACAGHVGDKSVCACAGESLRSACVCDLHTHCDLCWAVSVAISAVSGKRHRLTVSMSSRGLSRCLYVTVSGFW